MIKTQFLTNKDSTEDKTLNELLYMMAERLPQYRWLIENKNRFVKKSDSKSGD